MARHHRRTTGGWQLFPHGSDVGVRGTGATREEAFEQAALALTAVVTDPRRVRADRSVRLACQAPDDDLLLYEWLNALIAHMAMEGMLFSHCKVTLPADGRLEAEAWGEAVDVPRHRPAVEVKGATLTELAVRPDPQHGWIAQCVVDV